MLRGICSAYQRCSVFRCVGTPIHQTRPLCALGQVVKTSSALYINMMSSAWSILVDIFMILLKLKNGQLDRQQNIDWLHEAFYGKSC
jgi:hypothetical protein